MHFLAMTILYRNNIGTFSALMLLNESEFFPHNLYMYTNRKRAIPGKSALANADHRRRKVWIIGGPRFRLLGRSRFRILGAQI